MFVMWILTVFFGWDGNVSFTDPDSNVEEDWLYHQSEEI